MTCVIAKGHSVSEITGDSRKISFSTPPSAGNDMDEIHTDVGGTGL
jgi:hypothetical protein